MTYDELDQIQDNETWKHASWHIVDRQQTNFTADVPTDIQFMVPHPDDKGPIFGHTSASALRQLINDTNSRHQLQHNTALLTLQLDGFILKPPDNEGMNPVPLPQFNWNDPIWYGAIQTALHQVINNAQPSERRIPPIPTLMLNAAICQLLVINGGRLKTTLTAKPTKILGDRYRITFSISFKQTHHPLTTNIADEQPFLVTNGDSMIKRLTIDTDDRKVLQHAMHGDIITE